ncbi:D-aminoacyl-tRNA deacylase [Kushneria pakistanensis]|uniref:D-aminoacyl-tRNA deacylase n=1 Tax=Kushneria pakistanensis TaxID=1508770 RepID=A0ABQ3FHH8_9GAMM|nr:D-aminoacyl-tRNA deacylase [Kushneria pakistanensis]GHC24700.1 D-aminoacyl-tRNA deacylase [Kushneria pakistanensis]
MRALIQRVSLASVHVDGERIGAIEGGLLALIGVERDDTPERAEKLLHKMLNYRIFSDDQGRMNLGLSTTQGGLLLVSQFTLVADTRKGLRPGFSSGATPADGERLFNHLVESARRAHPIVEIGRFGADMQVSLINDGPVTFILES